jgi:hypothetical protein
VWDEKETNKNKNNNMMGRIEMKEIDVFLNNKGELEMEICDENEEDSKANGRLRMEIWSEINEREIEEGEEHEIIGLEREEGNVGTLKVNVLSWDVCRIKKIFFFFIFKFYLHLFCSFFLFIFSIHILF